MVESLAAVLVGEHRMAEESGWLIRACHSMEEHHSAVVGRTWNVLALAEPVVEASSAVAEAALHAVDQVRSWEDPSAM
jgi:hypothetical protein